MTTTLSKFDMELPVYTLAGVGVQTMHLTAIKRAKGTGHQPKAYMKPMIVLRQLSDCLKNMGSPWSRAFTTLSTHLNNMVNIHMEVCKDAHILAQLSNVGLVGERTNSVTLISMATLQKLGSKLNWPTQSLDQIPVVAKLVSTDSTSQLAAIMIQQLHDEPHAHSEVSEIGYHCCAHEASAFPT